MFRSTLAALLAAAALFAVPAAVASASAATTTLTADVTKADGVHEKISLLDGDTAAGRLTISRCAITSQTAFVCSGHGTVQGMGPGAVRIRWSCPVNASCQNHATGTLKSHGNLLVLLKVAASVRKFETQGTEFSVRAESVGE